MQHGSIGADIAKGLRVLRRRIDEADIPSSKLDETINLAAWNIRELGKKRRLKASLHLIAEILGQFDLIAVTELRDDISDLERILRILGPYWKVVFSDFNADRRGNRERIAYVYDERAVVFTGLAAEADPPRKRDKQTGESVPAITWWRSPFMASFRAGDFDFILLTAHIRWDVSGGERSREKALKLLADWVEKRRKEKHVIDKDIIVMGDFNIPKVNDRLFRAVTSHGLRMPQSLRGVVRTNLADEPKRYDQILYHQSHTKAFSSRGGALDFYRDDHRSLFPGRSMSKSAFTYQLSDHLPLWVQLDTDIDDERLDQIINRARSRARRKRRRTSKRGP